MSRCTLLAALIAMCAFGANADSIPGPKVNYIPQIGGAVRARWEMETESGRDALNRFQLRNARVTLAGQIARPIDYFFQVDLCNSGKMQFLDGWARLALFEGFRFQAGQFRVPFGVDTFLGPGNYIFANRSFIGRDMCNVRAVGVKLAYQLPHLPLLLEGGVFSPGTISDSGDWNHGKQYAAKATVTLNSFRVSASYFSRKPVGGVRINMADAAVVFSHDRWLASAEYLYASYTRHAARDSHGFVSYVDYGMPVHAGIFNHCSFQARFDVMTAYSTGVPDADGMITSSVPARRRITAGATISRIAGSRHCDLRLNYEKYFYNHGVAAPEGRGDKIVAELVLKF